MDIIYIRIIVSSLYIYLYIAHVTIYGILWLNILNADYVLAHQAGDTRPAAES